MLEEVQDRRMSLRQMMVAGRAVASRSGPAVMKWSQSLTQSVYGRTELQPVWSNGQNEVLEFTEIEERWVVSSGNSEESSDQARRMTGGEEG